MTIGEKIKCFRTLKNMTQKTLGEKAGIGEATIRKYELGIRNPKPAQLKKIAQALEIGENILLDIQLNELDIKTVGDAMALIMLLDEILNADYYFASNETGEPIPSTIGMRFRNEQINQYLARWIVEKNMVKTRTHQIVKSNGDGMSPQEIVRAITVDKTLLEISKQEFMSNTEPINSKNDKE